MSNHLNDTSDVDNYPLNSDPRPYGQPHVLETTYNDDDIPERPVESFKWLINTFHRDLVDQLLYKTTKVYTTRHRGTKFIVIDRVRLLPNNTFTDKGDTTNFHAKDIELYTLEYQKEQPTTLQVTLTSDDEPLTDTILSYIRDLPPLTDPIREFILTTGLIVLPDPKLPKTHKQAMKSPEAAQWTIAEQQELDSMTKHEVFTPMYLPPGKKKIETRWVYVIKYKNGAISKFKARLVAKGYEQIYGIDYEETFAPVAKLTSLRIVLAIAAKLHLDIQQMDVETAFLNATLEEEVYISVPDGVTVPEGCNCLRLNRALYGLKQSPREWYNNINGFLQSLAFKRLQSEHCLYLSQR